MIHRFSVGNISKACNGKFRFEKERSDLLTDPTMRMHQRCLTLNYRSGAFSVDM